MMRDSNIIRLVCILFGYTLCIVNGLHYSFPWGLPILQRKAMLKNYELGQKPLVENE